MLIPHIRRLLVGGAALATTVALLPNSAVASVTTTAPAKGLDPTNAFVVGSTQPLTAAPKTEATQADANGGTLGLTDQASLEAIQGRALTSTLTGGDSVQVFSLGAVSRTKPDGTTVWQRNSADLYRDWGLTFTGGGVTATPQLAIGTDPADPFRLVTDTQFAEPDTQPYVVGDFNGDGVADVAVAQTVGVNLGAANCSYCKWSFKVPGSDLTLGTFVTVLDGVSGKTLYHELDPGFVTQLAVAGGNLIVGDETGSPTSEGQLGAWNSQSTVRALKLRTTRTGSLKATPAWSYSTKSEWGLLLGLHTVGTSVALTWSDTPVGLGVPGPPDGHVLLLDAHGKVSWEKRTAGYPVLSAYDASRGELAVVEQTDPAAASGYTLDAVRASDGKTLTTHPAADVLPTALTSADDQWIVAGIVVSAGEVESPYYSYDSSVATSVDPATGKTRWEKALAGAGQPASVTVAGDTAVVASWLGSQTPTAGDPVEGLSDLQGFKLTSGADRWHVQGDVASPLSLAVTGAGIRGVTEEQDAVTYSTATGKLTGTAPLPGQFHAAVDVGSEYVAGGESGAVYAYDKSLSKTMWRAYVGGPVHQIVPTVVAGRPVLAVAATTGLVIVDQQNGKVLHTIPLTGQYVWNVAAAVVNGRTIVTTGTDRLEGFDASTGQALWTYRPDAAAWFTDPAIADGMVVAEYQSQVDLHEDPSAVAALGVDALTGKTAWTAPADLGTIESAQLINGVVAGPGLPGAAFTYNTTDGNGRVEVRDVHTGALIYQNTDPALGNHNAFALDPTQGLVAIGSNGAVRITPDGPVEGAFGGTSAAFATAGGTPILVSASTAVSTWPLSVFTNSGDEVDSLADYTDHLIAHVSVTPDDKVLSLPVDWVVHEVLTGEMGQRALPYLVSAQRALDVFTLTGQPAAKAAKQHATAAPNQPKATSVPLSDKQAARSGKAVPAGTIKVRGYAASGQPLLAEDTPAGYDPATMRAYLGLTGTGAGQTVAIVDAPGDPNIKSDLDQFSQQYGLPAADLTIKTPDGTGDVDGGWGLEESMDVEWVHSVAPAAKILLVESYDGSFSALFKAVDAAAALHPDAISMSWGIPQEFTDETYYDQHCTLRQSLCVAATGDYGHPGGYPAYSPAALAVGGTTLTLGTGGSVTSETAWSGTGGGRSWVEGVPAYQKGVVKGGRGIPDVSYDADPNTGVAVYDTTPAYGQTGWWVVGGTSLGAPSWSAVIADTDQLRAAAGKAALTQAQIYAASASLGDVTEGTNGTCPDVCSAGKGYDFVTGLGSPRSGVDAKLAAQ